MTAVPDDIQELVEQGLATYDVNVDGEITGEQTANGTYEVLVPFHGELLFDEVLENQGQLLYNKSEEGEISWRGIRDGNLVLAVTTP